MLVKANIMSWGLDNYKNTHGWRNMYETFDR